MRSAATMKNSIWGILSQIVVCVLSLFSRRVMIDTIGVEGVGLNAFLTSIITMLSLAELGIGTAIVYHMYMPLANGDTVQIKRLMNFYKTVYRAIAAAILVLGLILLPFMPKMAGDTSYSKGYISLIFVLFLLQTTSSYFFTYKRSLLSADQKQYVITLFDLGYKIFTVVLGIAVLKLTRELAYYLILLIISTVGENVFLSKKVDKMYPYILEKSEKLPKKECIEIARDVKNIFIAKLSAVVTTSTDSILINVMVGTVQTGLYSNYNIILSTLSSAVNQFASSMRGSIGNLVASETKEHIERVLSRLLFIMFLIGSFCACCLTGLIDPFIALAFGKNLTLGRLTVYVCIFNLYMTAVEIPVWSMVTASGLFKADKYISLLGTAVNLLVSYFLGKSLGMAGILIGTSCTFVIKFTLKIILFYNKFLKLSCIKIFIKNLLFACVTFFECFAVTLLTGRISLSNPYAEFAVFAVISAVVPIALGIVLFFKTEEFKYSVNLFKNTLAHILKR